MKASIGPTHVDTLYHLLIDVLADTADKDQLAAAMNDMDKDELSHAQKFAHLANMAADVGRENKGN